MKIVSVILISFHLLKAFNIQYTVIIFYNYHQIMAQFSSYYHNNISNFNLFSTFERFDILTESYNIS